MALHDLHWRAWEPGSLGAWEPGSLQALGEYGKENGIFKDRLQCVAHSAESYFQKRPDQDHEGEVAAIIQQSSELSVVRHRIAHGMTRPVLTIPSDASGWVAPDTYVYFLGSPWYAVEKLRTPWIGTNADGINQSARQFLELANRVTLLSNRLHPERQTTKRPSGRRE